MNQFKSFEQPKSASLPEVIGGYGFYLISSFAGALTVENIVNLKPAEVVFGAYVTVAAAMFGSTYMQEG